MQNIYIFLSFKSCYVVPSSKTLWYNRLETALPPPPHTHAHTKEKNNSLIHLIRFKHNNIATLVFTQL